MRWISRRPLIAGIAAAVLVLSGAVALAVVRPEPATPSGTVVLYGDSLAMEAAGAFVDRMGATTDAEVVTRVVPGAAPCDLAAEMEQDAPTTDVAVLSFAGNNVSECLGAHTLEGDALAARYDDDLRAAVELFATSGTRVVLVEQPPAPGLPGEATTQINEAIEQIVTEWAGRDIGRVRQAAAGDLLTAPDGGYTEQLPCPDGNDPAAGCEDGQATVRNPDRVHLCPVDLVDLRCPVPSPGAALFGGEIARVAAQALDPLY